MEKLNDSTFDIEINSIRELNPNEVDEVNGGGTPIVALSLLLSCYFVCDLE